jgi:DNA repair protein RadC
MPEKPQEANVVELVQASKKDTLSELAKIGREMRVAAERIIALSKEIDDAAIAAEQRIAEANNAADKLKQLQSLLKGLT